MARKRRRNNPNDGPKRARIRQDIGLLLHAETEQARIPYLIARRHRISRAAAAELLEAELTVWEKRRKKRKTTQNDTNHPHRGAVTPEETKRAHDMVRNMCLFDDYFFQTVFKDNKRAAEELLRPILNDPDLTVEHISVQETLPGFAGERAVVIDLRVEKGNGDIAAV